MRIQGCNCEMLVSSSSLLISKKRQMFGCDLVLFAFLIINFTVYAFQVGWRPASAHCCPHLSMKKKGVCSMYVYAN